METRQWRSESRCAMSYLTLCITTIAIILVVATNTSQNGWVRRGRRAIRISITTKHARSITDRGACLSDTDCPISHFCSLYITSSWARLFSCIRRRVTGAKCDFDSMCQSGNYCGPRTEAGDSFCQLQHQLNASCDETWPYENICQGENNWCDPLWKKCAPVTTKIAEAQWLSYEDCQKRKGSTANPSKINSRARKMRVRSATAARAITHVKAGATEIVVDLFRTSCSMIGDNCDYSMQCGSEDFISSDREERTCNFDYQETGKCAKENDLFIALGVKCNPFNDICDRRKGIAACGTQC